MDRPTIVYSAQTVGFEPGFRYRNPKYFQAPLVDTDNKMPESIIVVGNWPAVAAAYEALGVKVVSVPVGAPLRDITTLPPPPFVPPERQSGTDDQTGQSGGNIVAIVIPDDWKDLKWIAPADELSLRSLASSVSPVPVKNKKEAIAAIEAYLAAKSKA